MLGRVCNPRANEPSVSSRNLILPKLKPNARPATNEIKYPMTIRRILAMMPMMNDLS